jgi:hypothetical protein
MFITNLFSSVRLPHSLTLKRRLVMKPRQNGAFLALGVLLSVTSVLAAVEYSGTAAGVSKETTQQKKNKDRKTYTPETVTEAPLVRSKIKDLEIVAVRLENQGTPNASIGIDIVNNSDSAVVSLEFVSGNEKESYGKGFDALLFEDAIQVGFPPHSLYTFDWSLGAIMQGETVFLSAAIFADGREEGDKRLVDGIKNQRKRFQQRLREGKAKNGGQP